MEGAEQTANLTRRFSRTAGADEKVTPASLSDTIPQTRNEEHVGEVSLS